MKLEKKTGFPERLFAIVTTILLVLWCTAFSAKAMNRSLVLLGQGTIKEFSMEQRFMTFKSGTGVKLKIGNRLQVHDHGQQYDYRVLKPGINVKAYGAIKNNMPVVYRIMVSLPVALRKELNAQ